MKRLLRILLFVVIFLAIFVGGAYLYVKNALPNVGEAPDIEVGITPERVERGAYLANHVFLCMDCHSQRDYTRFAGPIKEGTFAAGGEVFDQNMGFPGRYISKNLTPHHLGSWTDGEIFRAITMGVNKDGDALFPIMPYPFYAKMSKEDIFSVIAYLRSLDPVVSETEPSTSDFPMSLIINTIPQKVELADMPEKAPDKSDILEYGEYITTGASCVECHTQRDERGQLVPGMDYAGGAEYRLPGGKVLRSSNITPDKKTGIGSWTEEDFLNKFRHYTDSSFVAHQIPDGEFNTIMPWIYYSRMDEDDLRAIYAYLMTIPAVEHEVVKWE